LEGKSGFIVLIGIVAFLSLTLALLVGYVFFVQGTNPKTAEAANSQNKEVKIALDEELTKEKLFEGKMPFNLKSNDSEKISVIVVSAEISYFKKIKGIKDTAVKIADNKSKMQEIVGTYFQGLTIEDVMAADAKEIARKELVKRMNECLASNEVQKSDIIYTIVFDQWLYQ
jgi:flagellar basal body-associated protein FliL